MKDKPLVSILSPCYNVEMFLPQCLDSIVNQTYTNLQIVLIDDGSKDNTWGILQDYSSKDSRIEVYHQENQGVASTRNKLLDKVRGEYVLFVDSDDWIEPNMIEFLLDKATMGGYGIVTCAMIRNNEPFNNVAYREEVWNQDNVVKEFLRHIIFNGSLPNKLVRSSLFDRIRLDCGISYGEDALFIWQVMQKVEKVLITNKCLYHYRMNESSISHTSWSPNKKGSGHYVWKRIVESTEQLWPQYADIAQARYAIEDMWGLYYASLADYPCDEHIKERQKNVRDHLKLIRKSGLISLNKIIAAYALAYWYSLGKLLKYTR